MNGRVKLGSIKDWEDMLVCVSTVTFLASNRLPRTICRHTKNTVTIKILAMHEL